MSVISSDVKARRSPVVAATSTPSTRSSEISGTHTPLLAPTASARRGLTRDEPSTS